MDRIKNITNTQPWTAYEEYLVLSHIVPDEQLSIFINRSLNAIYKKRTRLLSRINTDDIYE